MIDVNFKILFFILIISLSSFCLGLRIMGKVLFDTIVNNKKNGDMVYITMVDNYFNRLLVKLFVR